MSARGGGDSAFNQRGPVSGGVGPEREAETMWFCSHDGYSPSNTGRWCDLGCGSDYNRMIGVPTRLVKKVIAAELEAAEKALREARETFSILTRMPPSNWQRVAQVGLGDVDAHFAGSAARTESEPA